MKTNRTSSWTKADCWCCLREKVADVIANAKWPTGQNERYVRCSDCRRHCPQPQPYRTGPDCHLDHTFGYTA